MGAGLFKYKNAAGSILTSAGSNSARMRTQKGLRKWGPGSPLYLLLLLDPSNVKCERKIYTPMNTPDYTSDFGKSLHLAWWESMYFGRYGKLKAKNCCGSSAGSLKVR